MATRTNNAPKGAQSKPMCCVTIGGQEYLMPAAAGMKVAELMAGAIEARKRYAYGAGRYTYVPGGQAEVAWCSVLPEQLRTAEQAEADEAQNAAELNRQRARRLSAEQPKLPAPEAP